MTSMTWEHRKNCPYVVFEGTTFRVLSAAHLTTVAKSWDGATWLLVKCALVAVYRTGFVDCTAQQSYCILLHCIIHWPMVFTFFNYFFHSVRILICFLRTLPWVLLCWLDDSCEQSQLVSRWYPLSFPDFPYLFLVNLHILFGFPKHYYTQIPIQK